MDGVGNNFVDLTVPAQHCSNEATDRRRWTLLLRIGSADVVRLFGNKSVSVV